MPTNYTAVTIGPIYSTMQLTSSPAGLWGASYLFSWLAKELCLALVSGEDGIPVENFVAPYFLLDGGQIVLSEDRKDLCEIMRGRGVGMFHDRIIFCSQGIENPLGRVKAAREQVLQTLAEKLKTDLKADCGGWLNMYLRIYAAELPVPDREEVSDPQEAFPLIYLGKYLSAMELEPQFPSAEERNPLLALFENPDRQSGFKNAVLKDSFLCRELSGDWMLFKPGAGNIKDLEDIAAQWERSGQQKHQQYYAVLKSDGDSMGKLLEGMTDPEKIRAYSRQCLSFCAKAAEIILDFGGMPIYAGGDDLLGLSPVVGRDGTSVFDLIERLRGEFNETFAKDRNEHGGSPTISFGVAVQYYKSPLYEAMERADTMLRRAKDGEIKNACFLNLQKHSGQTVEIYERQMDRIEPNLFAHLESLFQKTQVDKRALPSEGGAENNVAFLSSAGYQVETFAALFCEAVRDRKNRDTLLSHLYENLFDNAAQKAFKPYLEELKALTALIFHEQEGQHSQEDLDRCIKLTEAAIRIIHFLNERKEEA